MPMVETGYHLWGVFFIISIVWGTGLLAGPFGVDKYGRWWGKVAYNPI